MQVEPVQNAATTETKTDNENARIEAFSDGVFAFAITVLVLDLKVPPINEASGSTGLLARLISQWPMFLAFLTSFGTILIMWINHRHMFRLIKRGNHWLLVFNGLLLLGVTIVPFSTELLATYIAPSADNADAKLAAMVYSGIFILISIFFNLLWWYASSQKLLDDRAQQPGARTLMRQYLVGPVVYLVALLLAIIDARLSLTLNLLLAGYFALPDTIRDMVIGQGRT